MTHRERMLEKIPCAKCGAQISRQYLSRHQSTTRCRQASQSYQAPTPIRNLAAQETAETPMEEPQRYTISIPETGPVVSCPVEGCPYTPEIKRGSRRTAMRRHFLSRHSEDTIIVEEEGLLPRCPKCGFFSRTADSAFHQNSKQCALAAARRRRHFKTQRQNEALAVNFSINGEEIERVSQFRYLGRILSDDDDDSHAALRQLDKARKKWNRLVSILRSEGVNPIIMGYFYKAVVQMVLIYGSESWVVSGDIMRKLCSFHHQVARYLTDWHIQKKRTAPGLVL